MTSSKQIYNTQCKLYQLFINQHFVNENPWSTTEEIVKTELENFDDMTLNLLLENEMYPLDIEDKTFSFDMNYPQSADNNVNETNLCALHTAIVMLSHIPFIKESIKDFLDCSDEEYYQTKLHKKEHKEMFQAIYDYLNTGKKEDFLRINTYASELIHEEAGDHSDASDILSYALIKAINDNMRINPTLIFTSFSTVFTDKGHKNKKVGDFTMTPSLFSIHPENGENINSTFYRHLQYEKIPLETEPPFLLIERFRSTEESKDILQTNVPIFVSPNAKIVINTSEYKPFAVAEWTGGHWLAYANSVKNIQNNTPVYVFDDTLSQRTSVNQNTQISTPMIMLFYNKNFFEKYKNQDTVSVKQVLKDRINKLPREAKILYLQTIMGCNVQNIVEHDNTLRKYLKNEDNGEQNGDNTQRIEENQDIQQEKTNKVEEKVEKIKTIIEHKSDKKNTEYSATKRDNFTNAAPITTQQIYSNFIKKNHTNNNNTSANAIGTRQMILPLLKSSQIQKNDINTKLPSSNIRTTQQQNPTNSSQKNSQTTQTNSKDNKKKQNTSNNNKTIGTILTLAGIGSIVGGFFVKNKNTAIAICLFCLGGIAIIAGIICFAKDFGNDKPINNLSLKQNLNNVSNNQSLPIQ